MINEKERDNTLRGENNFQLVQAIDWIKQHWKWLGEEQVETLRELPEELDSMLRDYYGDADWEDERSRFSTEFPDFGRQGNGENEARQDEREREAARADTATEADHDETRHGPRGPIDDRELDQRQRGPGAE